MGKIFQLATNPFSHGIERVSGREEKTFRVRVGDYRILYSVFNDRREILISDIDRRENVYD